MSTPSPRPTSSSLGLVSTSSLVSNDTIPGVHVYIVTGAHVYIIPGSRHHLAVHVDIIPGTHVVILGLMLKSSLGIVPTSSLGRTSSLGITSSSLGLASSSLRLMYTSSLGPTSSSWGSRRHRPRASLRHLPCTHVDTHGTHVYIVPGAHVIVPGDHVDILGTHVDIIPGAHHVS